MGGAGGTGAAGRVSAAQVCVCVWGGRVFVHACGMSPLHACACISLPPCAAVCRHASYHPMLYVFPHYHSMHFTTTFSPPYVYECMHVSHHMHAEVSHHIACKEIW